MGEFNKTLYKSIVSVKNKLLENGKWSFYSYLINLFYYTKMYKGLRKFELWNKLISFSLTKLIK